MKKRMLAVFAAAILGSSLAGATSAQAAATHSSRIMGQGNSLYFFGNVCTLSNQCINDILAGKYNGAPQQFWNGTTGEPNGDWNVWNSGTVDCTPNSFPFYTLNTDLLADCNNFWRGKVVLKFAFAPAGKGSGFCLDSTKITSDTINATRTQLWSCVPAFSQTQSQYFIYTASNWLVSVYGTKLSWAVGANNTFWVGTCPGNTTANTEPVCLTAVDPQAFVLR